MLLFQVHSKRIGFVKELIFDGLKQVGIFLFFDGKLGAGGCEAENRGRERPSPGRDCRVDRFSFRKKALLLTLRSRQAFSKGIFSGTTITQCKHG